MGLDATLGEEAERLAGVGALADAENLYFHECESSGILAPESRATRLSGEKGRYGSLRHKPR